MWVGLYRSVGSFFSPRVYSSALFSFFFPSRSLPSLAATDRLTHDLVVNGTSPSAAERKLEAVQGRVARASAKSLHLAASFRPWHSR